MAKQYGWVDYANLAANLAQLDQLSGLRQQVARQNELEAQREAHIRRQDRMRQIVFEVDQQLASLAGETGITPTETLIRLLMARAILNTSHLKPENFSEFADKDRVGAVQEKLKRMCAEATKAATPAELEEADACFKLAKEAPDLDNLIELKAEAEALQAQIQRMESRKNILEKEIARHGLDRNGPVVGGCLGFFVLLVGFVGLGVWLVPTENDFVKILVVGVALVLAVTISFFIIAALAGDNFDKIGAFPVFEANVKVCTASLGCLGRKLKSIERDLGLNRDEVCFEESPNRYKQLQSQFGEHSLADYRQMRQERRERIHRAMPSFSLPPVSAEETEASSPPADQNSKYFYYQSPDKEPVGIFTASEIGVLVKAGIVTKESFLSRGWPGDWRRASECHEIPFEGAGVQACKSSPKG